MKINEVIKTLTKHNQWRRGAEIPMIDPTKIGITIDKAIELLLVVKEIKEITKKKNES